MAPANTPSPRDHDADANPDLARKKQRLSEDADSSTDEPVVVEACEPEDLGSYMDPAIEFDSDPMESYAQHFFRWGGQLTPLQSAQRIHAVITENRYVDPKQFVQLATELNLHVQATSDDSDLLWKRMYLDHDRDFFDALADLVTAFMDTGDLFEVTTDLSHPSLEEAFIKLNADCATIALRVLPFLSDAIKSSLSRRDSAQVASREQRVEGLAFVRMIHAMCKSSPLMTTFSRSGTDSNQIMMQRGCEFLEQNGVPAIVELLKSLTGAMRQIKGSWSVVHSALMLMNLPSLRLQLTDVYQEVEEVLDIIKARIIPVICEKHTRALPEGFHKDLIHVGEQLIRVHVRDHDYLSAAEFYDRFVKAEADAILPAAHNDQLAVELQAACGDDLTELGIMFSTSWALQVSQAYLNSDIMDIRNVGLTALQNQLEKVWAHVERSSESTDCRIAQCAARFLRQNEITAYIFGPESHANLVSYSGPLFAFLAATLHYTDQESDIIWRACTTSVEADFVNAAFSVLTKLLPRMEFSQLNHIADKFITTPIPSLSLVATEFLPILLRAMGEKSGSVEINGRLTIAFNSINILKNANSYSECDAVAAVRKVAMSEVTRSAGPLNPAGRGKVYDYCIPEIANHTPHATTAVEIVNMLLGHDLSDEESAFVARKLPFSTAVDELCAFVEKSKKDEELLAGTSGVTTRLTYLARLLALPEQTTTVEMSDRLFHHIFGELAVSTQSRAAAWETLMFLVHKSPGSSAAALMWSEYARRNVRSLPSELATKMLIMLIGVDLKDASKQDVNAAFPNLLNKSLWKDLVRFATTSPVSVVATLAAGTILDRLFVDSVDFNVAPKLLSDTLQRFVQMLVDSICSEHHDSVDSRSEPTSRHFFQLVDLLNSVLTKSREIDPTTWSIQQGSPIVLGTSDDESDVTQFTAEIFGPETKPTTVKVRAASSVKVSELFSALCDLTGAEENRVIVGGSEVTGSEDVPLIECGINDSSTIMVQPKYSFGKDVGKVLKSSGPVEEEIMSRYSALEVFVDGPESMALKMYAFLKNVGPSAQARSKVTTADTTTEELFPPDKKWRTIYSLFIFQRHLHDFLRLGVLDSDFVRKGLRHFTDFILDASRAFDPSLSAEVFQALTTFLQEQSPLKEKGPFHSQDATMVADRMIHLLHQCKQMPVERGSRPDDRIRARLAELLYRSLLLSCKVDTSLWTAFTKRKDLVGLHADLLFDDDLAFSAHMAQSIRNGCHDTETADDVVHFYWQTLFAMLPQALNKGPLSCNYFDLAYDVLNCDRALQADEQQVRELIEDLLAKLWSYQHTETVEYLRVDVAMHGLLRLLAVAFVIFKSFKIPIHVQGLPQQLFQRFLFSVDGSQHPPLVHGDTRALVFDLIRATYVAQRDYADMIRLTGQATNSSVRSAGARFPGHDEWLRSIASPAGLTNLGMTCYMNSLLQQLYGNLQFRKFVLDLPIVDCQRQNVLAQVQELFAKMQSSVQPVAETTQLAQALNIQTGSQEDVHGFYATFLSVLEENLFDADAKKALTGHFTGTFATQVKGECGHVSTRSEPFTDVSITVKNRTRLQDSLDEFVQGEPMEGANKYKCLTCAPEEGGRLVKAMKRICLDETPNSLTFCLKRFTFEAMALGEGKVNDHFGFPAQIDMSRYQREHLEKIDASQEPDIFQLTGVIVHQGSLEFGHYWSYVRVPGRENIWDSEWMYLEDTKARRCEGGFREVQAQCCGGLQRTNGNATERPDNAYVLMYERKSHIEEAAAMAAEFREAGGHPAGVAMVPLPDRLSSTTAGHNRWRNDIGTLFDQRFSSLIFWLLEQYPSYVDGSKSSSDVDSESEELLEPRNESTVSLESDMSDLIVQYALRIVAADPAMESKVENVVAAFAAVVRDRPRLASRIMYLFAQDDFASDTLMRHHNPKVRAALYGFFYKCLALVREHAMPDYRHLVTSVIDQHALVFPNLEYHPTHWREFFDFAANIANLGVVETELVLDHSFLMWALDVIYIKLEVESRKRHIPLTNLIKNNNQDIPFTTLLEFIYRLLDGHVDLSIEPAEFQEPHAKRRRTDYGISLKNDEFHELFKVRIFDDRQSSILHWIATRPYVEARSWEEYAPGKLMGLFLSEKSHLQIRNYVEVSMTARFDAETNHLQPLLLTTLHHARVCSDGDFQRMLLILAPSFTMWPESEGRILKFLTIAHTIAPHAVLESISHWACGFLLNADNFHWREVTAIWLRDHLFSPSFIDDPSLVAPRTRVARSLVNRCARIVSEAYRRESTRAPFNGAIAMLADAENFVLALCEYVELRKQDAEDGEGDPVPHELQVECDEAKTLLGTLRQLNDTFREWEGETRLVERPGDANGARTSIELDSDGVESESDFEDAFSEEM